jgi:hypothetical protein
VDRKIILLEFEIPLVVIQVLGGWKNLLEI